MGKKQKPFPEIFLDKKWDIYEDNCRPRVNIKGGEIYVPFDGSGFSQFVRLHEQAHIKYTPSIGPESWAEGIGVEPDFIAAAEDMRINAILRDAGIVYKRDTSWTNPKGYMESMGSKDKVLMALAVVGTPVGPSTAKYLKKKEEIIFNRAKKLGEKNIYNRFCTEKVARYLQEIFGSFDEALQRLSEGGKTDLRELPDSYLDSFLDFLDPYESKEDFGCSRPIEWGEMSIETPGLTEILPGYVRSKKKRYEDMGTVFARPERILTDQKVFVGKGQRRGGASVLIDQSGSMNLTPYDIKRVMTNFPASIIGTYSAYPLEGVLRIIAQKSRRVADEFLDPYGAGNIIDLPALKWLSGQVRPRYWISDGRVTGVRDVLSKVNFLECQIFIRQHNIQQFKTIREFLRAVECKNVSRS